MAYKALYRSYRPTTFSEVVGQKHVIQTLKNSIKDNRTSHAYVFSGLRGIGKTTIARILAKAVNCQNPVDGEPCNNCPCCQAINNNETTDIIELDAASNNGVDEIRSILDKVNFLPSFLNKKVYIIDEVHMLSTAAFNALLKTLEEPPAYVMFILATTEPHKIPLTILSRCQRFDFKQLSIKELTDELTLICQKENIQINNEALEGIAEAAEGGMRDALSILDQASVYSNNNITLDDVNSVTGNISNRKLIELIDAFNEDDATKSINIVNELLNMGKEVSRLTTNVIQFCRDILLYKSLNRVPADKYIYTTDEFKNLAESSDENRLFYYIDVLVDVQNKIRFTNSQKIYLEVGIMKIVNSVSQDIDILGRIKALEENASYGYNPEVAPSVGVSPALIQQISALENKIKKLSADFEKAKVNEFEEKVNSRMNVLEDVVSKTSVLPASLDERVQSLESRLCDVEKNSAYEQAEQASEYNRELEEKIKQLENSSKQNATAIAELLDKDDAPVNNGNNDEVILDIINKIDAIEKQIKELPVQNNDDSMRLKELEAAINQIQKNISGTPAPQPAAIPASTKKDGFYQMSLSDYLTPEAVGDMNKKADDPTLPELKAQIEKIEKEFNLFKTELENKDDISNEVSNNNGNVDINEIYELIDLVNNRVDELKSYVENSNSTLVQPVQVNEIPVQNGVVDSSLKTTVTELKTNYFVLAKTLELLTEKLDNINIQPASIVSSDNSQIADDLEFVRGLVKELQEDVNNLDDKYVTKEELKILINKCNTLDLNMSLLSDKCNDGTLDIKKRANPFEKPIAPIEDDVVEDAQPNEIIEEINEEKVEEPVNETIEDVPSLIIETPVEEPNNEVEEQIQAEEPIIEEVIEQPVNEIAEEVSSLFTETSSEETNNEIEEQVQAEESVIEEKAEEVPVDTENSEEPKEDPDDLTAKIYDVHIIENILHESRSAECRSKKESIVRDWPKLIDKVGGLLSATASLLIGADVKANGNTGLIITYSNAQLCNLVMEPKTHQEACEIIKMTYDTPYDFIAVPEEVWVEKRIEYHNQYRSGIIYPTLSPINHPSLHIVKVSKEPALSERQKLLKKADDFFGTDD